MFKANDSLCNFENLEDTFHVPTAKDIRKYSKCAEKAAKAQCVRFTTERVGRKKIIHGFDECGREIYTAYRERKLFSSSEGSSFHFVFRND